jgi:hypothetical protein
VRIERLESEGMQLLDISKVCTYLGSEPYGIHEGHIVYALKIACKHCGTSTWTHSPCLHCNRIMCLQICGNQPTIFGFGHLVFLPERRLCVIFVINGINVFMSAVYVEKRSKSGISLISYKEYLHLSKVRCKGTETVSNKDKSNDCAQSAPSCENCTADAVADGVAVAVADGVAVAVAVADGVAVPVANGVAVAVAVANGVADSDPGISGVERIAPVGGAGLFINKLVKKKGGVKFPLLPKKTQRCREISSDDILLDEAIVENEKIRNTKEAREKTQEQIKRAEITEKVRSAKKEHAMSVHAMFREAVTKRLAEIFDAFLTVFPIISACLINKESDDINLTVTVRFIWYSDSIKEICFGNIHCPEENINSFNKMSDIELAAAYFCKEQISNQRLSYGAKIADINCKKIPHILRETGVSSVELEKMTFSDRDEGALRWGDPMFWFKIQVNAGEEIVDIKLNVPLCCGNAVAIGGIASNVRYSGCEDGNKVLYFTRLNDSVCNGELFGIGYSIRKIYSALTTEIIRLKTGKK